MPHGVDHARFSPTAPPRAPVPDEQLLRRLGVRSPFVLFVGTLEPRKAVPELVAAFDRIADEHPGLSLVLAGRPGWGADAVTAAVSRAWAGRRVLRTGYVPDEAVPALLRQAAVTSYAAMEEGFGLPALEALACGSPLVTTAGTTMAELSEGAAVLVARGSVDELAAALRTVLAGGPEVEERRRAGTRVAARHTWAASAAGHVAAYRWAASAHGEAGEGRRGGAR